MINCIIDSIVWRPGRDPALQRLVDERGWNGARLHRRARVDVDRHAFALAGPELTPELRDEEAALAVARCDAKRSLSPLRRCSDERGIGGAWSQIDRDGV